MRAHPPASPLDTAPIMKESSPSPHWRSPGFSGDGVWRRAWELTWRLFVRDFTARYRQSLLGYFWAVAPTLVTAVLFSALRSAQIMDVGVTSIPYPAYIVLMLSFWHLFVGGLTATTESLVSAGNLMTKTSFPRESLVLASFGRVVFELLIRLVVVAVVFAVYRVIPAATVALVPLVLALFALLTFGIGLVLAAANAIVRDVGSGLAPTLSVLFFTVPIVYPAPTRGLLAALNDYYPPSAFLIASHDLVVRGHLTQPWGLLCASLASLVVFFAGWWLFRVAMPLVSERI